MRSFDLVDYKVGEGEYFLKKLEVSGDLFEVRFLFSAFVSAIRSITFCLQASLSDLEGFKQWYENQQSELRKNQLAKFFLEARNISQKVGVVPISSGSYNEERVLHYFDMSNPEFGYLPEDDVITSCQNYFRAVLKVVYDCYVDFGVHIDPHQHYTKANYDKIGKTIDDLDEYMMGVKGWTAVTEWPEAYRWQAHRNNTPGCRISGLFIKYLNLEKPHPPILPENPEDFNGDYWVPPSINSNQSNA